MKKIPKNTKAWASEAYEALEKAIELFNIDHPTPDEDERLALVSYSISIAAGNRGIEEKSAKIKPAAEYVLENLAAHLHSAKTGQPIYISLCFLIGYLDTHVSFGLLDETKLQEIMLYLSKNFEVHK